MWSKMIAIVAEATLENVGSLFGESFSTPLLEQQYTYGFFNE